MPCWYFGKKELRQTPSFRQGMDSATEARYRREGARFIIDAGTKLGLRHDTCGTGVVYFHRFYMFHSFQDFHRYVVAACCLFLAGKVEETPKKCHDLLKTTKQMLTKSQYAVFGDDPKEELMTVERILLQTVKFDLMIEHSYTYLLKFAKMVKGDKAKTQKLVQMSWTFINDSLCTTLCLQWEPDVIAVALMYLSSRLNKSEITDWVGKPLGYRGKWYEFLVENITLELLEDICHQVLDLYSPSQQGKKDDSPPPPPPPPVKGQQSSVKRSRSPSAEHAGHSSKLSKVERSKSPANLPAAKHDSQEKGGSRGGSTHTTPGHAAVSSSLNQGYSQANPYMSTGMYSSSFLSTEGVQSIQTLVGGTQPSAPTSYSTYNQPAAAAASSQPQYSQPSSQPAANSQYTPAYPPAYPQNYNYQVQGYQQQPQQQQPAAQTQAAAAPSSSAASYPPQQQPAYSNYPPQQQSGQYQYPSQAQTASEGQQPQTQEYSQYPQSQQPGYQDQYQQQYSTQTQQQYQYQHPSYSGQPPGAPAGQPGTYQGGPSHQGAQPHQAAPPRQAGPPHHGAAPHQGGPQHQGAPQHHVAPPQAPGSYHQPPPAPGTNPNHPQTQMQQPGMRPTSLTMVRITGR